MLAAMTAWRTHPKCLSVNLKDGREILELSSGYKATVESLSSVQSSPTVAELPPSVGKVQSIFISGN